jgi:hypothetical protein
LHGAISSLNFAQNLAKVGSHSVNLSVSGLPALVVQVGFIVVFAAPVWLAARMVDAANPTLLRSALSLIVGVIGSVAGVAIGGGFALLLAPLAFLLAFKYILGTSLLGSLGIAVITVAGYAAMVHFIGAAFTVSGNGVSV